MTKTYEAAATVNTLAALIGYKPGSSPTRSSCANELRIAIRELAARSRGSVWVLGTWATKAKLERWAAAIPRGY